MVITILLFRIVMYGEENSNMLNSNKVSIGSKSNGNVVVQGSTINNTFICNNNEADIIKILGDLNNFEEIQTRVGAIMAAAEKTHPLYPNFRVVYNNQLHRLISTPDTEEALKKYPKQIKGKFEIDLKKYPYMNRSEMPWEYAYRTQTPVELLTTEYKEYLGDIEDPFPITQYSDGMITVINPPEFPAPIEANLVAGGEILTITIRRTPCMEYGQVKFVTTNSDSGLNVVFTIFEETKKITVNFSKILDCELSIQLMREKFLYSLKKIGRLIVNVGPFELVNVTLSEKDLKSDMFLLAPYMIDYIESLLSIEKSLNCRFNNIIENFTENDYYTALVMASSLRKKWHRFTLKHDNEIRCNYDQISDSILNEKSINPDAVFEGSDCRITLQGKEFEAQHYLVIYRDARLNNCSSVKKNKKKKKDHILLTFSPVVGKSKFFKYSIFINLRLI